MSESNAVVVREDGRVEEPGTELMAPEEQSDAIQTLNDMGFITPIATPEQLRKAFAQKQKLYAAILDPSDYLYVVELPKTGGKGMRQAVFRAREQAEKAAKSSSSDSYKPEIRATPKKSGIVKLARALGIIAQRKAVKGLPEDPNAQYSYVVYEAQHKGTGLTEEGVGWCDKSERGGQISTHDCIATADTRAYNRAVLRLSGFGDVSADEIIAGASMDEEIPPYVPEKKQMKKPDALPPNINDEVVAASRAWAEKFAERGQAAAGAQQATKVARELRAKTRRGDTKAAVQLGEMGLTWQGRAQDDISSEPFEVDDAPPVKPEDVKAVEQAASGSNGEKQGWDLSGQGAAADDAPMPEQEQQPEPETPPSAPSGASEIPDANQAAETITTAQAKRVSKLLLKMTDNDREKAQQWLKHHAGVERSSHLRDNQYDAVMNKLRSEVGEDA